MVRRRATVLLVLAAVAALVGGAVAGGATRGSGKARGGAAMASHPGKRPKLSAVPSISVVPSTCFVAGQLCSIHPCVEYVAPRLLIAPPPPLLRARMRCAMYP